MLTLKEKRNRNSRGYITKSGFDQHPDSNSAGKSRVTAHLESHWGKGPRRCICSVGETSKMAVQFRFVIRVENCYHHKSVSKLQPWLHVNAVSFVM